MTRTGRALLSLTVMAGLPLGAVPAAAQWSRVYEQTYLPAEHNWEFRENYVGADRLFNAFDYGHAILYERLYTEPGAPAERLEEEEFRFLTTKLLRNPPRVPLEEGAIEVAYAKMAPEAKIMFDWAHILHRQTYDIWADEDLSPEEKDAAMAEVLAYYKSRPDIAFSSMPKTMELMDGQYYSLAFREKYPKFNGLIWAYHWLQVGLYEPLVVGTSVSEKKALVDATVARFWQMIDNAPENMPHLMPMTAAVAPAFAKRYPEVAIIFDNLHMMHDVVSDILASPEVPRGKKREEILRAARLFRDSDSFVMTPAQWWQMAVDMGAHNMGGPAVGFLAALPEPTVPRGMSMAGMEHGAAHAGHGARPAASDSAAHEGMEHGAMGHDAAAADSARHGGMGGEHMRLMHEMHMRMMADPVIRERMMADTAMHRIMMEMMEHMPAERREEMMRRMHGAPDAHHRHEPEQQTEPKPENSAPEVKTKPKPGHTGHPPATKPKPKPHKGHSGHGGHGGMTGDPPVDSRVR